MIEQLILVRHGETLQNVAGIAQGWNDSALSERGQQQVQRLAERVKVHRPNALFSSSLERAMTTARAIAVTTGLPIQTLDELREMNYGNWEGKSFLDVRRDDAAIYERWIGDPDCPCPNGESHNDVLRRIEAALRKIEAAANGTAFRPVLVTHGTAIRISAAALLHLPPAAARSFAQDNAAINVFLRRGERYVMKKWNDTGEDLER
ncbi:MAG: histidine phosphatase family protein [Thermoanaerobaculia bacterium]